VSPEQSANARAPILVIPSGNLRGPVSPEQSSEGRKEGRKIISRRMRASSAAPFAGLALATSLRLGG